jgi:hypothetical protein
MNVELWITAMMAPLVSGAVGAAIVYYFGVRQLAVQRRMAFVERQMSEFYAPLAGMRRQVLAKTEVRLQVSHAANAAWRDICRSYGDRVMHDHEAKYEPFGKIIDYENRQFESELIPVYRQMLNLFTTRYHLADPDTRAFYQPFLEFVEIWNRSLEGALPGAVVQKLGHGEEKLLPFYGHLENRMQQLQDEVAQRQRRARIAG